MTTTLAARTPRSPSARAHDAASAIQADALETLVEDMTLADLRVAATAALDAHVGDWDAFARLDVAPEPSTFHTLDGLAAMTFGLILRPAAGWPTLATVVVTATTVAGTLRLVSVDRAPAFQQPGHAAASAASKPPRTTRHDTVTAAMGASGDVRLDDPAQFADLLRSIGREAVLTHSSSTLEAAFNWDDVTSVGLDPYETSFTSGDGDVAMEAIASFTLRSTGKTVQRTVLVTIIGHADDDASPYIDLL